MVSFKNIRIKKKGGGTRTQRVQVLASGKYKFVKNLKSTSHPRPKTKARKVKRKLARRKKRRSGKSLTTTAFKLVRIGALAAPAAARVMHQGITYVSIGDMMGDYTGFNWNQMNFDFGRMAKGWGPYLGACLATYGIPKIIGIIRRL